MKPPKRLRLTRPVDAFAAYVCRVCGARGIVPPVAVKAAVKL